MERSAAAGWIAVVVCRGSVGMSAVVGLSAMV